MRELANVEFFRSIFYFDLSVDTKKWLKLEFNDYWNIRTHSMCIKYNIIASQKDQGSENRQSQQLDFDGVSNFL